MSVSWEWVQRRSAAGGASGAGLCLVSAGLLAAPWLTSWLQYERAAVEAGQWWRLATCHLTHWSVDHLLWDAVVFAALWWCLARLDPRRMIGSLLGAALAIPLAIWALRPEMETYRGLSGLDSALFVLLAMLLLREALAESRRAAALGAGGLLAAFVAKVAWEAATGGTLFATSVGQFEPVPLAHVVGGVAGAAAALLGPVHAPSRGEVAGHAPF